MFPPQVVLGWSLVCLVCLCAAAANAVPGGALLKADFERDPRRTGWQGSAPKGQRFQGAWAKADARSGGRYLLVEEGWWHSPAVPVRPLAYYRLRFRSRARSDGYWACMFHDADGKLLDADHYDSLPGSREWRDHEYCFRANVDAVTVRIRFQARRSGVAIDNVTVEGIDRREAAAWADRVCAEVSPVDYAPPAGRWKLLPKTMRRLRAGPGLRIVVLGDSIANDTSNSAFDVLLERAYPRCRVEVVNSVRSGTGCGWYRRENRIRRYVLPHKPDLLAIAGISSGYDIEAMRDVIRQVRAESDCEVLLLTGCIHPRVSGEVSFVEHADMPRDEACEVIEAFPERLRAMATDEKVELLDLRRAWDEYILRSPRPHAWYLRDPVHANTRGKCVVGRILLRYFEPRRSKGR